MAEHLARIIGTEEDRVNCPFYWKIGACRHGDQCSRSHYKPSASQTIILRHMYQNPPVALAISEGQDVNDEQAKVAAENFETFYSEVWEEMQRYGEIEDIIAVDNIGDHMIGNVYVKFISEDDASTALQKMTGIYYGGRMLNVEFSPVTDFREARCRQFVDGQCTRGGYCNFMHMKHVPRVSKKRLLRHMYRLFPSYLDNLKARCTRGEDMRIDAPTRDWGDGDTGNQKWARSGGNGGGGGGGGGHNRRQGGPGGYGGGGRRGGDFRRDHNHRGGGSRDDYSSGNNNRNDYRRGNNGGDDRGSGGGRYDRGGSDRYNGGGNTDRSGGYSSNPASSGGNPGINRGNRDCSEERRAQIAAWNAEE